MKKKFLLSVSFLFTTLAVLAQDAKTSSTKSFWDDPLNDPLFPLYAVSAFIFIVIILVMVVAIYMVSILNMFVRKAAEEKAAKLGVVYVPEPSWWQLFWDRMNAAVPVEKEQTIELDHNYDGIRELDNHLPPWWKWLFIGTIGWGAVYLVVFHITASLPLSQEEYETQLTVASEARRAYEASQPVSVIDENTLVYSSDATILSKGKQVFTSNNCQSCHRTDGGGNNIGPNLTDPYWIHGGSIKNIFGSIKNGYVDKGMPAWGKVMSPQDVRDVAFYVMSLVGTNPANAKAPQGELYKPEEPAVKSDSTKTQASI